MSRGRCAQNPRTPPTEQQKSCPHSPSSASTDGQHRPPNRRGGWGSDPGAGCCRMGACRRRGRRSSGIVRQRPRSWPGSRAAGWTLARERVWNWAGAPTQDGLVLIDLAPRCSPRIRRRRTRPGHGEKTFGFHPLLGFVDQQGRGLSAAACREGRYTPSNVRRCRGGGAPWASMLPCQSRTDTPAGRAAAIAATSV